MGVPPETSPIFSRITTLSRNTLILLFGNVGGAVLAFLLSAIIGRTLGGEGLGVYSAVLAWVFFLSMFVDAGLGSLLTRDLAQDNSLTPDYIHTATIQRLSIGGFVTLLLLMAAPLTSDNPAVVTGLRISAPMLVIEPFFGLFTAVFRARQVMLPIAVLNIGMLIPQVILTAFALMRENDIQAALLINVLTSSGRLLAGWAVYRWLYGSVSSKRSIVVFHLMRLAFPFAIAAILIVIQQRIGILLLERLADIREVGYYAAAMRFIEAWRMIPNALFGALFPALAALVTQPESMNRLFRRVWLGLAAFALVSGLAGTLLASTALHLAYGAEFLVATPVLQIAVWILLPTALRSARAIYWYAHGREGYVNAVTGVMLILQVISGLWLIPRLGAVGLVISTIFVEWIGLILLR
jgi:O-antigen/teichoic acid export membrane protein